MHHYNIITASQYKILYSLYNQMYFLLGTLSTPVLVFQCTMFTATVSGIGTSQAGCTLESLEGVAYKHRVNLASMDKHLLSLLKMMPWCERYSPYL